MKWFRYVAILIDFHFASESAFNCIALFPTILYENLLFWGHCSARHDGYERDSPWFIFYVCTHTTIATPFLVSTAKGVCVQFVVYFYMCSNVRTRTQFVDVFTLYAATALYHMCMGHVECSLFAITSSWCRSKPKTFHHRVWLFFIIACSCCYWSHGTHYKTLCCRCVFHNSIRVVRYCRTRLEVLFAVGFSCCLKTNIQSQLLSG